MDKQRTVEELEDILPSGGTLVCGGFQTNRVPMALVNELASLSHSKWHFISLPNPLPLAVLLKRGLISYLQVGFSGLDTSEGFVIPASYRRVIESGELEYEECDVYGLIQGLRAGGMGLPFLPAPGLQNSDYQVFNRIEEVEDPFHSGKVAVVPSITPDVALLHVQQADKEGNLWIEDPLYDELIIKASRKVIVSCEQIVSRIERPAVFGLYVDHVIEIGGGARPSSCKGYYRHDEKQILEILKA